MNGSRKYVTPDGTPVPSVTTILGATKPAEEKKALNEWRKRVGEKKAQEITTEAAGRGTRMHKWLENFVKTGKTGEPGTNPYSIQSHTMATSIINQGLVKCNEFWGTEVGLFFPEVYAGTTDLVGVHESADSILDFKQSNREKREEWISDYFLQVVFYGTAHNEMFGTKIRKGVILMCTKDNIYQEFIIDGKKWDDYTEKMWRRLEQYYLQFVS